MSPTYAYGPIQNNAIAIQEQDVSYWMTEAEILEQLTDLRASHNQYSNETLYLSCLEMLEGALQLVKKEPA